MVVGGVSVVCVELCFLVGVSSAGGVGVLFAGVGVAVVVVVVVEAAFLGSSGCVDGGGGGVDGGGGVGDGGISCV